MRNLITDLSGIRVGHATDLKLGSGVTAIVFEEPFTASCDLRGGGPGTRETDLLDPVATVEKIDAITLSGGSAFGLDAASGVMAHLASQGRGYKVRDALVPIVPAAILFDLNGPGDKQWGRYSPYRELGYSAAESATQDFKLGSIGAGTGATTENIKSGIGSASAQTASGHSVGALVAVNAAGRVTVGDGPHFWAAPFESGKEFGGRGFPSPLPADAHTPAVKGDARASTTLAVIATDAILSKSQCKRLAVMAGTGLARSIYPVFTPLDGDIVFAVSTGRRALADPVADLARIGAAAANCLARAVARGVYEAMTLAGGMKAYKDKFK